MIFYSYYVFTSTNNRGVYTTNFSVYNKYTLCTLGTELRGYSRRNSRIYKPFKLVTLAVL